MAKKGVSQVQYSFIILDIAISEEPTPQPAVPPGQFPKQVLNRWVAFSTKSVGRATIREILSNDRIFLLFICEQAFTYLNVCKGGIDIRIAMTLTLNVLRHLWAIAKLG
jgi:hypothetical protein